VRKSHIRKGFALLATLVALFLVGATPALEEKTETRNVAVVNGISITQADFDLEMRRVAGAHFRNGHPLQEEQIGEIGRKVCEALINRELLYQESKREDIKVDMGQVDRYLQGIRDRCGGREEYARLLNMMNVSEDQLINEYTRALAVENYIVWKFGSAVTVKETEKKEFYENHQEYFQRLERVRASHILILVADGDPRANVVKQRARKKLEGIRKRAMAGEEFTALAREFSQCPSRDKDGDLGYFHRGVMEPAFEKAAFDLEIGEISEIIETGFGYHLIKITDKQPSYIAPFDEMKEKIVEHLRQSKIEEMVKKHVDKLRQSAKVERFCLEGICNISGTCTDCPTKTGCQENGLKR